MLLLGGGVAAPWYTCFSMTRSHKDGWHRGLRVKWRWTCPVNCSSVIQSSPAALCVPSTMYRCLVQALRSSAYDEIYRLEDECRTLTADAAAARQRAAQMEHAVRGRERELAKARDEKEAARAAEKERVRVGAGMRDAVILCPVHVWHVAVPLQQQRKCSTTALVQYRYPGIVPIAL